MLPTRWAIVQGMGELCAALGLKHPLDTSKRFSAATLNSDSAGVKGKVLELLRLFGKKSRATEGRHELKTHIGNVLEEFFGCNLKAHTISVWVDGKSDKEYSYYVEVKAFATLVKSLLSA